MLVLLLLISRLTNRSGLRISHSKVFSSDLGTLVLYTHIHIHSGALLNFTKNLFNLLIFYIHNFSVLLLVESKIPGLFVFQSQHSLRDKINLYISKISRSSIDLEIYNTRVATISNYSILEDIYVNRRTKTTLISQLYGSHM